MGSEVFMSMKDNTTKKIVNLSIGTNLLKTIENQWHTKTSKK